MADIITALLTKPSMRSDRAVQDGLILHAKAGEAWGGVAGE
jgi:hypothetical protein